MGHPSPDKVMEDTSLPDAGEIRESLRSFNEQLRLVENRVGEEPSTDWILEWEDGMIVRVPRDRDDPRGVEHE